MISSNIRQRGSYGGLSRYGTTPINRLSGVRILLMCLGSIGLCLYPSSWTNPPMAPPFRNSLRKILRNFSKRKHRDLDAPWHVCPEYRMSKWKSFKSLKFYSYI